MSENIQAMIVSEPTRLNFDYTNHRGEHGRRDAITKTLWFGTSPWFPGSEPQFYLTCIDVKRNEPRDFRCQAMRNVVRV